MKINMNLERYDIGSLSQISDTADDLKHRAEYLEYAGELMLAQMNSYAEEFTSDNYQRSSTALASYLKKMSFMKEEMLELSKSCKELTEKIQQIWS